MTREEKLSRLIGEMHKLGFYSAYVLDVHDFTAHGYRREDVESAIETVSGDDIGYIDHVIDELEHMRQWA